MAVHAGNSDLVTFNHGHSPGFTCTPLTGVNGAEHLRTSEKVCNNLLYFITSYMLEEYS